MSELIGIIGAGTMGNGIAQTAASNGFDVVLCDISAEYVEKGIANVSKSLDRFVKKETITEDQKTEILARIKSTTDLNELRACSLVVEAATENFDIKEQLFEQLDTICPAETILSSNT